MDIREAVDGGFTHGFGVGHWLCWKPWGAPESEYGCGRSAYEEMKEISAERRMINPPPVDKPLPPEGILVYLSPTTGGYEHPIWRFFPDPKNDRPANDEDFAILTGRCTVGA